MEAGNVEKVPATNKKILLKEEIKFRSFAISSYCALEHSLPCILAY
jgi:hypothetical protein